MRSMSTPQLQPRAPPVATHEIEISLEAAPDNDISWPKGRRMNDDGTKYPQADQQQQQQQQQRANAAGSTALAQRRQFFKRTNTWVSSRTVAPAVGFRNAYHALALRFNHAVSALLLSLVVVVAIIVFELIMYGSREACYDGTAVSESHADWKTHCAFRTYWLAAIACFGTMLCWFFFFFGTVVTELIQRSKFQLFVNGIITLLGFAMVSLYAGSLVFLPQTIVGYPAIILSDLNHWDIAHLPLANVSGTDANGIYLTDDTSLRIATEFAIASDGECMKTKKDCKNCQVECVRFRQVCVAPIVRTVDFAESRAAFDAQPTPSPSSLVDTDGDGIAFGRQTWLSTHPVTGAAVPVPQVEITAWAVCRGYGMCSVATNDGTFLNAAAAISGESCFMETWNKGEPTTAGKMHVISYYGQGFHWKDSGGYDAAIKEATTGGGQGGNGGGLVTSQGAVVVDWGTDPQAQKEHVTRQIEDMAETFAVIVCVCTLLQLMILMCDRAVIKKADEQVGVGKDSRWAVLAIYLLWGAAFIAMGVYRFAHPLDLQMHIFDKKTGKMFLVFGGIALASGYVMGGWFVLFGDD